LFSEGYAEAVSAMRTALAQDRRAAAQTALVEFYAGIQALDFSRQILERHAERLRVIRVPPCGWTDLGTPHRVASTVRDITIHSSMGYSPAAAAPLFLDLGRLACTA
jgi:mannose-1-phosphate guanylyltransferase